MSEVRHRQNLRIGPAVGLSLGQLVLMSLSKRNSLDLKLALPRHPWLYFIYKSKFS